MRDVMYLGSTAPADEECAQVGEPGYYEKAQAEGKRFIDLIRKELGPEPEGAKLTIKGNAHDFGTYYEVVCYYDTTNEKATEYAYLCESEAPTTWDGRDDYL